MAGIEPANPPLQCADLLLRAELQAGDPEAVAQLVRASGFRRA